MTTLDIIKAELDRTQEKITDIARSTGIAEQTLYSALRPGKKLNWEMMCAIADHFGRDVSFFRDGLRRKPAGTTSEIEAAMKYAGNREWRPVAAHQFSSDDFLTWWETHSGRLENFDTPSPQVDLFEVPDADSPTIKPLRTGGASLASLCFKVQGHDQLSKALEGFSKPLNKELVSAHLESLKVGAPVISYQSLTEKLPDGSFFVGRYRRILAPVRDKNRTLIANFSQPIPGQPLGSFPPEEIPRSLELPPSES
ncbi:hypothetical protein [Shimia sp.]|uniref:hypothetical protein n=1 Tax=Shimia sp. TaxID=1954381 RepID=UPI003BABAF12